MDLGLMLQDYLDTHRASIDSPRGGEHGFVVRLGASYAAKVFWPKKITDTGLSSDELAWRDWRIGRFLHLNGVCVPKYHDLLRVLGGSFSLRARRPTMAIIMEYIEGPILFYKCTVTSYCKLIIPPDLESLYSCEGQKVKALGITLNDSGTHNALYDEKKCRVALIDFCKAQIKPDSPFWGVWDL